MRKLYGTYGFNCEKYRFIRLKPDKSFSVRKDIAQMGIWQMVKPIKLFGKILFYIRIHEPTFEHECNYFEIKQEMG